MKRKNNFDKWFLLSWRKFVISTLIFIVVFFFRLKIIKIIFEPLGLYNFVYYGVSITVPLYLLILFFYTIINKKRKVKPKKTKNDLDKFLLLTWKKMGIFIISWVVAVVVHNFGSALISKILNIEFEEAFFFIIAVIVIPVYFIISVVYTLIKKFRRKRK